VWAKLS